MYNDDSDYKLEWSPEKRKLAEDALPLAEAWYDCACFDNKQPTEFCEHYLGMGMPYSLCKKCADENGYRITEWPKEYYDEVPEIYEGRKCEYCSEVSGLYY